VTGPQCLLQQLMPPWRLMPLPKYLLRARQMRLLQPWMLLSPALSSRLPKWPQHP
jgi:hypothetical protein